MSAFVCGRRRGGCLSDDWPLYCPQLAQCPDIVSLLSALPGCSHKKVEVGLDSLRDKSSSSVCVL